VAPTTVPDALHESLARDGARPLVTWLGADGARVELSVRSFENNVAKAANLLQDDADVSAGSRAVLRLAPHWQALVWLGACAATSTVAWFDGDDADPRVAVSVVGPDATDAGSAPLALATSLHPLGMPFPSPLPDGLLDVAVEVRAHGDRFTPYRPPTEDSAWLVEGDGELTHGEALSAGVELARSAGLGHGGRLLLRTTAARAGCAFALGALALPLAVDGSVVLVTDATVDVDEIAAIERCEATLEI